MTSGGVRVERNGPVTTVIMNRPEARNAVNGPAAAGLYAAFDEFDTDDSASVAVLWGDNGTFCAGADLKAFGTPDANPVHRSRARADGADPDGAVQAGDRRGQRLRRRGRARAGAVVRPAGGRGGRDHRRVLPPLGRAADRRRHRAAAAADRPQPRDGPDPHRPWRRRRTRRYAMGLANRVVPKGEARQRAEELAAELAALPQQCMRSDRLSVLQPVGESEAEAMDFEFASMSRVAAESLEGAQRFAGGRRTARRERLTPQPLLILLFVPVSLTFGSPSL